MSAMVYHLAGMLAVTALAVTECDAQDTSDWLVVDNRTGSRIVITQQLVDGRDQVSEVGPHTESFAGGKEICTTQALQARRGSLDGPVIDRRPASDGENCVETWIIEAD